jgi:hypothetical protein
MQCTYDLRGLDLAAWARRAQGDLAAHRAAGDAVVLVTGAAPDPELATLRIGLQAAGYRAQHVQLARLPAWLLVETGATVGVPAASTSPAASSDASAPGGA